MLKLLTKMIYIVENDFSDIRENIKDLYMSKLETMDGI